LIDSDQVISALADDTLLVSVMAVNNEVGTIQPLEAIGKATRSRGILLHSDASQGVGKVPINMLDFGIDFLSLSAHKIYGPKGTGALCVATADAAVAIAPQMLGGGQENGMRSGTPNVPGIVGLARAIELMQELAPDERTTIRTLRDALSSGLQKSIDGVHVNGNLDYAVPGALNVSIDGVRSTALLARIPNIGLSGAAACGGKSATSHVLTAMGLNRDRIGSALRFGVGRFNTLQDIESVIQSIAAAVGWIRNQPQFGLEMSR
jgi:cysteine desulfurase